MDENLLEIPPNPFEDVPDKYDKYNYQVQRMHALAIRDIYQRLEQIITMVKEHQRMHDVSSKAAMQTMEMPASGKTEKPN